MTPSLQPDECVFVGREAEMRSLLNAVDGVRAGAGRFVFLVGDGGIGKSRLLEEFASRAEIPDGRLLWGRCPEQSGAPTYWPWAQAIGAYADAVEPALLAQELGDTAADIARAVPGVAARLGLGAGPAGAESEGSRFRLFDGVARFLRRAAARAPLVLLFDDLHWADRASLALLDFVGREVRRVPLLVVGTYRERELRRMPDVLTGFMRLGQRLPLGGLDRVDLGRLVAATAGTPASDAVIADLHRATDGNPFFLEAVVNELVASGGLEHATPVRPPEGLRAGIRRRLEGLTADERRLLDVAAVVGRDFDLRTIALASELESATALGHLTPAIAENVVEEMPGVPGRFRFAHALIREALYADLLPADRVRQHQRIAHALEAQHAGSPDAPVAALAHHFFQAAPLGDAAKAVEYAVRAAEQAAALGAYEEAIAHYERALEATTLRPGSERRRRRLRIALAHARWRGGDERGARLLFVRAADTARAAGDAPGFAEAAIGFAAVVGLTGIVDEEGVRLLEEAIAGLGPDDDLLRCHALAQLATKRYFGAERAAAAPLVDQAVAIAERLGDPLSRAATLLARHYGLWGPDDAADRRAIAAQVVALGERAGERALALEGRMWAIIDALELGDVPAVDVELPAYARRAEEAGLPRYVAHAGFLRAMRAMLAGRLDEAERLGMQALAARPPDAFNNVAQFHAVQLYTLQREQGRLAELEPAVTALVEQHPTLPTWRAGLALLYADLGRTAAARQMLDVLTIDALANLPRDANWLPLLGVVASAISAVADRGRAAPLLALLQPYADRMIVIGTGVACWGAVGHLVGLLAETCGDAAAAEQHLEQALATHVRAGVVLPLAHTQVDLARVLRARGDPASVERAATLLDEATRTATALGLARVTARVAAVGADAPGPATSPVPRGVATDALLRREGEYWTVAYGGDTVRLREAKGLAFLARLLATPGAEVHVLDLMTADVAPAGVMDAATAIQAGLRPDAGGDAGDVLDPQARAEYRRRVAELREDLEEAEQHNDLGRAERARAELEFIAGELARGVGLGGRSRKSASAAERARQNVTRAIAAVVKKIAADAPALGEHLQASVRTGVFCSYDPRLGVRWQIQIDRSRA